MQKQGRDENTGRLSCYRKSAVKKGWKSTLHLLYSQATAVEQPSSLSLPRFFFGRLVFLCFHRYLASLLFRGPSLLLVNFYNFLCYFKYQCVRLIEKTLQREVELSIFAHIKRYFLSSEVIIWCVICSHKVHKFCSHAQLHTKQQCKQDLQYTLTQCCSSPVGSLPYL